MNLKALAVWKWGQRGFFSELNLLIYALWYCERNKYDLLVDFTNSNLPSGKTINDYLDGYKFNIFECVENKQLAKRKYGLDSEGKHFEDQENLREILFQDVWNQENNNILNNEFALISQLFRTIWKPSLAIQKQADSILEHKITKKEFACVHIRRGDKLIVEAKKQKIKNYSSHLNKYSVKSILIFSDDRRCFEECRKEMEGDFQLVDMTSEFATGHDQEVFNNQNDERLDASINRLLAEVSIMVQSKVYVGTFSSNIGRFVYSVRGGLNAHSADVSFNHFYEHSKINHYIGRFKYTFNTFFKK